MMRNMVYHGSLHRHHHEGRGKWGGCHLDGVKTRFRSRLTSEQAYDIDALYKGSNWSWCGTYYLVAPQICTIHTRSQGHGGAFKTKKGTGALRRWADTELYYMCWDMIRHPHSEK